MVKCKSGDNLTTALCLGGHLQRTVRTVCYYSAFALLLLLIMYPYVTVCCLPLLAAPNTTRQILWCGQTKFISKIICNHPNRDARNHINKEDKFKLGGGLKPSLIVSWFKNTSGKTSNVNPKILNHVGYALKPLPHWPHSLIQRWQFELR